MGTRALQFDLLLNPIIDYRDGAVASGYTVYFYAAGTSTAKNVWTEKEKTNPYTSRTLGSNGITHVYGDGIYKIIVKDVDGTTVYEWDQVKCQANTFTVQSKSDTYTATADDDMVLCDGTFTVNIATVTGFTHPLIIKRVDGTITVNPYSTQTIDGSATITLTSTDNVAILYPDTAGEVWYRSNSMDSSAVAITGGTIDGVTLGNTELASGCKITLGVNEIEGSWFDINGGTIDGVTMTSPKLNEDVAIAATASEINNACDGATAKNSHTHLLAGGATDVTASYAEVNAAADGIGVSIPRQVIVNIGAWDMDTTASKDVSISGIVSGNKIVGLTGVILDDTGLVSYPIFFGTTTTAETQVNAIIYHSLAKILVQRTESGTFDTTGFNDGEMNRGYLVISYID